MNIEKMKTSITLTIEEIKKDFDFGIITYEQSKERVEGIIKFFTVSDATKKLSRFAVTEFRRLFK